MISHFPTSNNKNLCRGHFVVIHSKLQTSFYLNTGNATRRREIPRTDFLHFCPPRARPRMFHEIETITERSSHFEVRRQYSRSLPVSFSDAGCEWSVASRRVIGRQKCNRNRQEPSEWFVRFCPDVLTLPFESFVFATARLPPLIVFLRFPRAGFLPHGFLHLTLDSELATSWSRLLLLFVSHCPAAETFADIVLRYLYILDIKRFSNGTQTRDCFFVRSRLSFDGRATLCRGKLPG